MSNVYDPKNLTVREVEEGASFGLNQEKTARIKGIWRDRFLGDSGFRADLKREVAKELRPVITEELRPEIQAACEKTAREKVRKEYDNDLKKAEEAAYAKALVDVRPAVKKELHEEGFAEGKKNFTAQMKQSLREEVRREIQEAPPSAAERIGAQEYLLDAEIECIASAEMASAAGEAFRAKNERIRAVRRVLTVGTLSAFGPLVYVLFSMFGLNPLAATFLLPLIVLFAYARMLRTIPVPTKRVGSDSWNGREEPAPAESYASKFLVLADRARRTRLVEVPLAQTKDSLMTTLREFVKAREEVDAEYHEKDVATLQKRRLAVRERMLNDVDPLKLFQVAEGRRSDAALEEAAEVEAKGAARASS